MSLCPFYQQNDLLINLEKRPKKYIFIKCTITYDKEKHQLIFPEAATSEYLKNNNIIVN